MNNEELKKLEYYINDYIDNHMPKNISIQQYLDKILSDKTECDCYSDVVEGSFVDAVKNEFVRFVKYFKNSSSRRKAIIGLFVIIIFLFGGIVL